MTIVVISPHRDDAAFSLGLSIDAWIAAGHTVSILNCFTQSTYAPYSDVDALHPNDRASFASALRRREDLAWNKLTGNRLSFHDLDLLDAPLRLGCSADEVLTVPIRPGDRALARVEGAIAKVVRKAADTVIAAPLAIGEHIDHRLVHQAALNVLAATPLRLTFYEDLPYATRPGLSDGIAMRAGEVEGLEPVFALESLPDVQTRVSRKSRIAECYDSQVDSEVIHSIAEFSTQYGGRERLWANTNARGSGLFLEETGA